MSSRGRGKGKAMSSTARAVTFGQGEEREEAEAPSVHEGAEAPELQFSTQPQQLGTQLRELKQLQQKLQEIVTVQMNLFELNSNFLSQQRKQLTMALKDCQDLSVEQHRQLMI